jgi:hypothetical protein
MDVAPPDAAAVAAHPGRRGMAVLVLLGIVLAVFGQTVGFGWVNLDDDVHVTANAQLNPVTPAGLVRFWTAPFANLYVPLAYTLFAGEASLSRLLFGGAAADPPDARLFHAVSVGLHLVNVLLVWRLLDRLAGETTWPATAGAALFAVHPLQVESVAWISEQRGLLAAACGLGAMVLHVGSSRGGSAGSGAGCVAAAHGRRQWARRAAALGLFGLGLLAKPQVATVPLVLFVIDVGARGWPARTAAIELSPWFALGGLVTLVTRALQPGVFIEPVAPWLRPLVAGDAVVFYAATLLWPLQLSVDYGRTPQVLLQSPAACAAAVAAWLVVAAILLTRRLGRWRVPVAVAVVALLPVLGFIPFLFQEYSTVADRYCYLALLGPALAVAWGSARLLERAAGPLAIAGLAMPLMLLAVASFTQSRVWRDSFTLWAQAIRVDPNTFLGNCNLGSALIDVDRPGEAVDFLRRAVRVGPTSVPAQFSLAVALDKVNRPAEAARFYENVLLLHPRHARAHNLLGVIHARQGRVAEAAEHFRAAVGHDPGYRDARANLERATKLLEQASDRR